MPKNAHLEAISADAERLPEPAQRARNPQVIHDKAEELARRLTWLPNSPSSYTFAERSRVLAHDFKPIFAALEQPAPKSWTSDDFHWLFDSSRLLYSELQNAGGTLKSQAKIAHVRTPVGRILPRVLALAEGFLEVVSYEFSEQEFTLFVEVFQQTTALQLRELWSFGSALKLVLLEQIAERGRCLLDNPKDESNGMGILVRSLRDIGQTTWKDVLEPLMVIDGVLRQDPAGAYGRMDFESRDLYRNRIANIAEHSDCSELETAEAVVALAEQASHRSYDEPRVALRESHVGYYLVDKGRSLLWEKVRFHPPFGQKFQALVRKHPDEFFLIGIHLLALAIMSTAVIVLTDSHNSLALILFSMMILFLPSSQSAVQLMNYLVSSLLPPEILPKLDFTEGIPDNCVTMVAIPTLLLGEKQARELVENLEVRFLGNHDPNIHFALLTDLADSREPAREDNPLITLCSELIRELNE
jgi:cyclic beta-1,2-glucan synthetase